MDVSSPVLFCIPKVTHALWMHIQTGTTSFLPTAWWQDNVEVDFLSPKPTICTCYSVNCEWGDWSSSDIIALLVRFSSVCSCPCLLKRVRSCVCLCVCVAGSFLMAGCVAWLQFQFSLSLASEWYNPRLQYCLGSVCVFMNVCTWQCVRGAVCTVC